MFRTHAFLSKGWRIGSEGFCHLPWLPRNALVHPFNRQRRTKARLFSLSSLPGFDNIRTSEAEKEQELDATTFAGWSASEHRPFFFLGKKELIQIGLRLVGLPAELKHINKRRKRN